MTKLATKALVNHATSYFLIVPFIAILFALCNSYIAVAQAQGCYNADGKQYAEGSRLGPFKCQGGQWIYVGE
jgi:hypothetical protein